VSEYKHDESRIDKRMVENIKKELRTQNVQLDLDLPDDYLKTIAWAVAMSIDNEFIVEWRA